MQGYNKGVAYGERVFRGVNYGVCRIDSGQKYDWILIPKDQEEALLESAKAVQPKPPKQIPQTSEIPPLLEILMRKEMADEGYVISDKMFFYKNKIRRAGKFNTAELLTSGKYRKQIKLGKIKETEV